MREVLSARLERWGYRVHTAETAGEAREAAEQFHPDVVVSDLVLPDATGLDLLEALRQGDPRRTILLITAYGTIDVAVKAIRAGASNFLTKPLDYTSPARAPRGSAAARGPGGSTFPVGPSGGSGRAAPDRPRTGRDGRQQSGAATHAGPHPGGGHG